MHPGQVYAKALSFERQTRQPGRQDGALGRNGLALLHRLLFGFRRGGRLEPSIAALARLTCMSISSAKRGLRALKGCGVLTWIRRAGDQRETNLYSIRPVAEWRGFRDPLSTGPPPHPDTWGATPPLPSVIESAVKARREGGSWRSLLAILGSDPRDGVAAALASFGRAIAADGSA